MADILTDLMNKKEYEVVIPEVYTKIIPKYYQGPTPSDLPRVNGVPVSMDDYMGKYHNFKPDDPFTPDLVFNPPEQNKATSYQSIADMVDMIDNDIDFGISNPDVNYKKILDILSSYTDTLEQVAVAPEALNYIEKARTAQKVIEECHKRYLDRLNMRRTGHREVRLDTFDAISKKFIKGE